MLERLIDRRQALGGLGAFALGGCAGGVPARPPILVNLADLVATPGGPAPTELATGADAASRITVPVRLNGEGPLQFVVDTGANHSVIATEAAEPLGLPSAGRASIHGIAGVEPAETVMVDRLTVGEVTSRRLRAPLLGRARLGADGLLGVDALKNRRVLIDFQRNQLQISDAEASPLAVLKRSASRLRTKEDPALVVVPARHRFGQLIIIDADVGGLPVTAFLDSGSQNTVGNLALRRQIMTLDPHRAALSQEVQLISATGQTASGQLLATPPLRMGGLRIGQLSAVFADLHIFGLWDLADQPAILVGVDVMRHFESIELNFGKALVSFRVPTPPKGAPRTDA